MASIASSRSSLQDECKSEIAFSSSFGSTDITTPSDEEIVIKTMMMNADKYRQDMEVGKIVAKSIKDGGTPQDSPSN